MIKTFSKSPLNYIGGKYRILPQLFELFPTEINTMVDLFAGGCDVCSNITANRVFANDINHFVIEIYEEFCKYDIDELIDEIEAIIEAHDLSKVNKDAYLKFRGYYNRTKNPLDLYVLVCYSFNYQFRFNSKHEYNNPFGKDRSCFSDRMKQNLIQFHSNIQGIKFSTLNFKDFDTSFLTEGDFLYADPPYRITTGSYNDGKRGFEGWTIDDDLALFKLLDILDDRGIMFALSNVTLHKGIKNEELIKWSQRYNIHDIKSNFRNSNYQVKDRDSITQEVLITNY